MAFTTLNVRLRGVKRTSRGLSIAVKQLVTPHPHDVRARRALKDFEHGGIQSVV
jgi:hypothetical protein